ncbi:Arb2 domain-containing protein [Biscogniauxia marginata]|nr:Arb2 domain-containing protein [Biscogniauxia marginata]
MFKRKWSGLPVDPHFPSDLKELGYFINEDDEVRSIENPDFYFKFFLNRNPRWNDCQRFAMNQALQSEIHARLSALGLQRVLLPLGTTDGSSPHVPIFASADIATKKRVVLIFGETSQDLGVLAHRVIGGRGGVDAGSLVRCARELLSPPPRSSTPPSSNENDDATTPPPGIVLANMGELLWWPAGRRTLGRAAFAGAPMASAACLGNVVRDGAHRIVPGNRDPREHVKYIFEQVVVALVAPGAGIDIVGLGDGADAVEEYLDWGPTWARWGPRVNCLAIVGGMRAVENVRCEGFRQFLRERARAYVTSLEPAGMTLSGPDGNPRTRTFTRHGCPVFSSGESQHVECAFIAGQRVVLDWLNEVALYNTGEYRNPEGLVVLYADPIGETSEPDWSVWEKEFAEGKHLEGLDDGEDGEKEGEKKMKGDENKFVVRVDSLSDSEDEAEAMT